MTVTLREIIAGLQGRLNTIAGLRVFDVVPGSTEFPAAFILPPDINYLVTFHRGVVSLELEVVVLVSAVADRMQKDLFDYLDWSGPLSILVAVDDDRTLGLDGIEAVVAASRPLGLEEVASYQAWGAAVRVVIHKTA